MVTDQANIKQVITQATVAAVQAMAVTRGMVDLRLEVS